MILAGCIASGESLTGPGPMCLVDTDCNTEGGAICDEGLCWGSPPSQAYAALLVPPPSAGELQPRLVPTELPRLEIGADGTIQNLRFVEPVTLRGRIVLACGSDSATICDSSRSIGAQIQVKRASRIPGGPSYVLRGTSQAGIEAGGTSFVLRLPPSEPQERYEVTIVPGLEPDPVSSLAPAELAPPTRFYIEATRDQDDLTWSVGDPAQHIVISGRVVDAVGTGIPGRRVHALPHADSTAILDRRSSLGITAEDGSFTLRIARELGIMGGIDIMVEPKEAGTAPILRAANMELPADDLDTITEAIELGSLKMPGYGELRTFTLPIRGIDGGGDEVPIPAAEVRITTYLSGADPNTTAIFSNRQFTDNDGNALIDLIPGSEVENRRYLVRVVPPPDTEYTALYDHEIDVGSTRGGVLAPVILQRRVPVAGTLLTVEGTPAVGTTVAAALAVGFRWSLDPASRALVDTLQLPEDVTDQSGRFVVWLEESLLGASASYDLSMRPADPLAPRWSLNDIDMTRRDQSGTVHLGELQFPDATYARGIITSHAGDPVPGAELRLFALPDDHTLCTTTDWPGEGGSECLVPPRYRGPAHSRDDGRVTLVLPAPFM